MNDETPKNSPSISTVTQAVGLAGLVIYALGFIVVNSHLAGNGTYSFEAFREKYLAAGLITAIAFGIFWFLVGRKIYHGPSDVKHLSEIIQGKWSSLWRKFCYFHVMTECFFGSLVGAAWAAQLFFVDREKIRPIVFALSIIFLFDYLVLSRRGIYKKYPAIALPIASAVYVGFLLLTPFLVANLSFWALFYFYQINLVVLAVILGIWNEFRNIKFTIFWIVIYVFSGASTFGVLFYDKIRADLGGGQPIPVRLIVTKEAAPPIAKLLEVRDGISGTVHVIGETDTELILKIANVEQPDVKTLRINKNAVSGIVQLEFVNSSSKVDSAESSIKPVQKPPPLNDQPGTSSQPANAADSAGQKGNEKSR